MPSGKYGIPGIFSKEVRLCYLLLSQMIPKQEFPTRRLNKPALYSSDNRGRKLQNKYGSK